ncbi:hypothetical protein H0H93_004961 [Arthromyces matolae]|nr:hypothetical protein H0H93_004961 [Arthromyces matolae]
MTAPPLGKYLASTEKKVRDKAIKNLSVFLSESNDALSKPDMDKLWKGIFYGFWMSDKPLVQQALSVELADLLLSIPQTSSALKFLRGFWEMIVREWNGIDRLRIDKYYMLVRRFVNASFRLLLRTGWDVDVTKEYNDILTTSGGPLCPDIKVPTSLAYHLADVYLEELDKVCATSMSASSHPSPAPLHSLLTPFMLLAAQTPLNLTYKRIKSSLLDPLFSALSVTSHNEEHPSKRARLENVPEEDNAYPSLVTNACFENSSAEGRIDGPILGQKLLKSVFQLASQPSTRDANRRKMYALWKDYGDDDSE